MAITATMVKELRERTGLGMMDCKAALTEADGDMELAIDGLRKRSALKAAKKAGRTTANGLLGVKVADDGSRGAMVEINIETDFAAKNDKFIAFVGTVLDAVYASNSARVNDVVAGELDSLREVLVQEIGENISVRRAAVIGDGDGFVTSYIHGDNRKAVLIELSGRDEILGRDLAMHITAINPMVVQASQVPADLLGKEREIFAAQAADSGKPDEIIEKMVEGRMRKFLAEVSLVDQPFVKDGDIKVGKLLADAELSCRGFIRFEVGEGIEVAEQDFAAEVAAQVKGAD
ncbi:MAG: translation elongation factor Ts [Gammaproteobacteria bacterium]|nr:translation elongation factor Ts [Gammaproteobacteria bacterium]